MQNKKWNRLKISFVAVLAVTWIPAQLCSAFPVYACEADTTAMLIQSAKKHTDISQTQTLTDTGFFYVAQMVPGKGGVSTCPMANCITPHQGHKPALQQIRNRMTPTLPQTAE